jgi:ClpP class serine protease
MPWKTLNLLLGLAVVNPSFWLSLQNDPLETIRSQGIELTPEEQEIFCKVRGKTLAEFSQYLLEERGLWETPHKRAAEPYVLV